MSRKLLSWVAVPMAALALSPLASSQAKKANSPSPASSHLDTLLADWQADHGDQWHIRANRTTGTAEMLYGGMADAGASPQVSKDSDWFQLTRFWVSQTYSMHGVFGQDLVNERVVFLPLGQIGTTDKMTVAMKQQVRGVPVEDGKINALFTTTGELLSLHSTSAPNFASRSTLPTLGAESATQLAVQAFEAAEDVEALTIEQAELVFAHVDDQETRRWTLAWQVNVQNTSEASTPVGYNYTIDAHSGIVLKRASTVHFFDVNGTLVSKATPGTTADRAANPPVDTPMPYARITSSAGTVMTDANGNFSFPGVNTPLNLTATYYGDFADVRNDQGAQYSVTFNSVQPNQPNTLVMNPNPTEFVTAQANAYINIARLRDWIVDRIPGDATADFRGLANCNLDASCNAFFDGGSTNYYNQAGQCNNTAFSSVVAHEVGHWLNVLYGTGNGGDGIGEGNADVFALYMLDDPILGSFFFTGGGFVRTGLNNRQYCGDGNGGCHGGVHADGEVWMGAAWKIRTNLNNSLGNTTGDLTADLLFLSQMNAFNQTTIDSAMEIQWLTLDDDNGNINDGTPNYQDIDDGFTAQGFPGFDLPFVTFSNHTPLADTTNEAGPYAASVDITASFNPPVASGTTFYRVDGGPWLSVPMTNSGSTFTGQIPGQVSPATVEYYFVGEDNTGGTSDFPTEGANAPFSFRVGIVDIFLVNEFEGGTNEGWTGGVAGDTATTGVWVRGDPLGTQAQPNDDHTVVGDNCWFTGQGSNGGTLGENDVDGGTTTLLSPVFDATGLNSAEISYWRWYSNDTGASANADTFVVSISNDGGSSWTTVETVGPNGAQASGGWFQHTFVISNFVTPNDDLRLRFQASDLGAGSIVEAAIDDVEGFFHGPSTGVLGTRYCNPAVANSSGGPATLTVTGSAVAADNNVLLTISSAPFNEFGIFLNGSNQDIMTNAGGPGTLCVGGSIGRYNQLAEVFNTGPFGTGSLQLDLTNTPTSSSPISVMAGMTINFQGWFRESPGSSNFSDAVSVTFQ